MTELVPGDDDREEFQSSSVSRNHFHASGGRTMRTRVHLHAGGVLSPHISFSFSEVYPYILPKNICLQLVEVRPVEDRSLILPSVPSLQEPASMIKIQRFRLQTHTQVSL